MLVRLALDVLLARSDHHVVLLGRIAVEVGSRHVEVRFDAQHAEVFDGVVTVVDGSPAEHVHDRVLVAPVPRRRSRFG